MLVWLAWLDSQYEVPARGDFYLMQVAAEVRRVLSKKPSAIKLSDFHLRFSERAPASKQQAAAVSKAAWVGRMTMPVKVVTSPSGVTTSGN